MFKNQTPQQLSLYIAIISAAALATLTVLLKLLGLLNILWSEVAMLFVAASFVAFIVNYYLIRYYIFRRIKLIYKIIHRKKFPPNFKADNLDMSQKVLDEVEKEVDEWAEQSS